MTLNKLKLKTARLRQCCSLQGILTTNLLASLSATTSFNFQTACRLWVLCSILNSVCSNKSPKSVKPARPRFRRSTQYVISYQLKQHKHSSALSRLGYCNTLLVNLPLHLIHKLQKVKNCATRITFRTNKKSHVKPLLHKLHWFSVSARIEYKSSTLF